MILSVSIFGHSDLQAFPLHLPNSSIYKHMPSNYGLPRECTLNCTTFCEASLYVQEKSMRQVLTNLWQDESAQDTSEYALLLLLITAALVAVVGTLSTTVQGVFSSVVGKLVPK